MGKVNEVLEPLLNQEDDTGNRMVFDSGKIYQQQPGESRPRFLGYVKEDNGGINYIKHEQEKNIMRKNNSWSIHFEILKHVDHVVFKTTSKTYRIDRDTALDEGQFLHFKESGYERKIYVPLPMWNVDTNDRYTESSGLDDKVRKLVDNDDWFRTLKPVLTSESFKATAKWVAQDRKQSTVYPPRDQTFRALQLTSPGKTKMVILGQDPYPSDHANGLAFGTQYTNTIPDSLSTIFQELNQEYETEFMHHSYDTSLTSWAEQGILLLNSCLTVRKGSPGSHKDAGWDSVVDKIIEVIASERRSIVFLLLGKQAQMYTKTINRVNNKTNYVLQAPHPAAESKTTNNAGFLGCGHFRTAQEIIQEKYGTKIQW